MTNSIKKEINEHIQDYILDNDLIEQDLGCMNELHHDIFNTDYYIIGYYNANEWLKKHDVCTFEAIDYVQQYEKNIFGETNTDINSESIVNMIAYIVGEEILFNQ